MPGRAVGAAPRGTPRSGTGAAVVPVAGDPLAWNRAVSE
jgi:hypothetical protein